MKIAVIAANGRSGQVFVEYALAAGHLVTAGIRGQSRLQPHANLNIIECDATNEVQLKRLLAGQEAVASFIGHVKGSEANVQTVAIQKIIVVMKELGINRLVSLTGTGVRFPGDKITLVDRILNFTIGIIDPARLKDGKSHVGAIEESGLDWTVIRVLKLQNTEPRPFRLLENGPTKSWVGRREVAQAALKVIEDHSYIQKSPIIGKLG
jgi:putative NADH-flavin reductase